MLTEFAKLTVWLSERQPAVELVLEGDEYGTFALRAGDEALCNIVDRKKLAEFLTRTQLAVRGDLRQACKECGLLWPAELLSENLCADCLERRAHALRLMEQRVLAERKMGSVKILATMRPQAASGEEPRT